ncbi:hypothetical protein A3860_15940 [Niastella vici]|uniref:Outer membrane protein beta-barrel domain-containing protein n=2 Tax=Niastella vici TaxID=1703345 RepID=A0A1V9G626_9BACT|nr:hypothetical protein A3860_15940 [Niastella vici]
MIAFAFSLFTTAHAQIKKGGIWLGGSVGYSETKTDNPGTTTDPKSKTIGVYPAIGFVVKDNLVFGIALNYNNYKTEDNAYIKEQKDKGFGGGVFLRQYVPIVNRLYIFGQLNAFYGSTRSNWTQNDYSGPTKYKKTSWAGNLTVSPGVSVAINKSLHLETGFSNLFYASYSKNKQSLDISAPASETKSSSFSMGASLENASTFYVGFRFLLNNKG